MTTNYADTFIAVSADCPSARGETPDMPGSIAAMQLELLQATPYGMTSDDLLFEVHARRTGVAESDRLRAHTAFFARSQACLRASPLVKRHGWGLHHDGQGRVAAVGVETDAYHVLAERAGLKRVTGLRSRRS